MRLGAVQVPFRNLANPQGGRQGIGRELNFSYQFRWTDLVIRYSTEVRLHSREVCCIAIGLVCWFGGFRLVGSQHRINQTGGGSDNGIKKIWNDRVRRICTLVKSRPCTNKVDPHSLLS